MGPADLLSDIHTPKRGKHEHRGVHAWHPYYAGYSEQFVLDTLAQLAEPETLLLDPWNGSGTSTFVAQRLGVPSIGIEINPVMVLHGLAKDLHAPAASAEILRGAYSLIDLGSDLIDELTISDEEAADWVHYEPLKALLAIKQAIQCSIDDSCFPESLSSVVKTDYADRAYPSKRKAFYYSALFQVLREVGSFDQASNPTWILPEEPLSPASRETVFDLFVQIVSGMLEDLENTAQEADQTADYWVMKGDSRELPLRDGRIDLVVTSPPYCTRIDYTVSTKPELLLLGYHNGAFDALRRECMGAPVIADRGIDQREVWGSLCNDFLDTVREHPSKASATYYLPIYVQYFRDAELSLRELKRVLSDGGRAAIVVQSSYYKEVVLPLGEVYVEISRRLGFDAQIAHREVVRQHMAQINTASRKYAEEKIYHEDVLLLQERSESNVQ